MDRLRILYYSCHEILEYDDLRMLTSEGHSVFSLGDFSNPSNRGHFRRSRPEFHQNGDWEAYVASGSQGPSNISRDFGARFDIAIVNHMPEWLEAAVRDLDCPIVYRSIGQSNPATEARVRAHEGRVKIVRYSNREEALEGFAATDKVIYFGKMSKDYTPGWEAGGALIERRLGLRAGKGVKLLTRTHALTCGLWQSLGAGPPEQRADDVTGALDADFIAELTEALAEFWRGALMLAQEQSSRSAL